MGCRSRPRDPRAIVATLTQDEREVLEHLLSDIDLTLSKMPPGLLDVLECIAFDRLVREEVRIYRRPLDQARERARRILRLRPKSWKQRLRRWGSEPQSEALDDL